MEDHGNLRRQGVFLNVDIEVIFQEIICQKVGKALVEHLAYLQIWKFIPCENNKMIKDGKIIVMLEKAIIEVVIRWGRRNSLGGQPGDLMWIWRMLANPTLPPTLSGSR